MMSRSVKVAATAVVAVAVAACAVVVGVRASQADDKATVIAVFANASPLVKGNKVQMHGVEVGTISAIALVSGHAEVTMDVDRSALPLHQDASARIEPVSLLGERFVDLEPGTASSGWMPEPLAIPLARTSAAVDLTDVVNTLDDPTSTALSATVESLGEGVKQQGGNVSEALQQLAPTLHDANQLADLLNQQNAVLNRVVTQTQHVVSAAADPLDPLVASAQQTMSTAAANRAAIDHTVAGLPDTLDHAQHTLGTLSAGADNTTTVLSDVRPLTNQLNDVSHELKDFGDAAQPALSALPPVLDKANPALDRLSPLVKDLGPAAQGLRGVSGPLRALSDQTFTHAPGVPSQLEQAMTGAADWAMATSGFDGLSHYFRAVVKATPDSLANTGLGALPPVGATPLNPVPRDPNGQTGYPGTSPLPNPPGLPNPDGPNNSSYTGASGQASPAAPGSPSATGLTPSQEHAMIGDLIGGGN